MAYWLLKTEPSEYSFADLAREKRAVWSGIANPAALKNLRSMQRGDDVLIYHTGEEKAIVGTAKIVKSPYLQKPRDPKTTVVDVGPGKPLPRPISLVEIKADPRFKEWQLVTIGRLSVVPTTPEHFAAVLKMSESP